MEKSQAFLLKIWKNPGWNKKLRLFLMVNDALYGKNDVRYQSDSQW